MKRKFRTILSITLCLIMVLGNVAVGGKSFAEVLEAFSVKASAAYSGTCGDNVTYSIIGSTLTIRGTGDMYDYEYPIYSGKAPWYGCTYNTVIIENGVTRIGASAFALNENLINVTIPNTVTSIGSFAFRESKNLTNINLPDNIIDIGFCSFKDCSSLTTINIPRSAETIPSYAFASCTALKNITIPNGVKSIGYMAFDNCVAISNITLPNTLISVNKNAFSKSKIEKINYLGTLSQWAQTDFCTFTNTESYYDLYINGVLVTKGIIEDGTTEIKSYAFNHCKSLTGITIPNTVTSIGDYAFCGCEGLKSVSLHDNLSTLGSYVFCDCKALETVKLSKKYPNIPEKTFSGCISLKTIYIPSRVSVINKNAFDNCSLLTDVYYEGSSKADINIDTTNSWLLSANWHYNAKMPDNNPSEKSDDPTPSYPDPVAGITETDIIKGNAANNQKTYEYKTAVTFNANVPEGGNIQWYVDNKPAGTSASLTVPAATKSYTVKVVITDKNGGKTADTENVTIKSSFFDKLIYFFKHLFNPNAYIINQQ